MRARAADPVTATDKEGCGPESGQAPPFMRAQMVPLAAAHKQAAVSRKFVEIGKKVLSDNATARVQQVQGSVESSK